MNDWPDTAAPRPLWLVTLADLALLLVGFFVLIQASEKPRAITDALRQSFGGAPAPAALPVMAAGLFDFAPGSATLPDSPATVIAWCAVLRAARPRCMRCLPPRWPQ